MSTPYVAQSDLVGMVPPTFLAEALDDVGNGSGISATWDQIAQDVSDEIDGTLGVLYQTPFASPFPTFIVRAAKWLAVDRLYKRRDVEKHPYRTEVDSIRSQMKSIADGDARLAAPGTTLEGPTAILISSPSRLGGSMI